MKATFAAGCFWHVEDLFRKTNGVNGTKVGYIGGNLANPTYEQVCSGSTGHAEAVQVDYNPRMISFEDLLEMFWSNHDPTTLNRQGPDIGVQYRSAVFFHSEEQREIAEKSKKRLDASDRFHAPIVTQIAPAPIFYTAEEYHQKYFEKHGSG